MVVLGLMERVQCQMVQNLRVVCPNFSPLS